jgi:hypothetical protein
MSELFDEDSAQSRIRKIEEELESLKHQNGANVHPLQSLKIKDMGADRFHILLLGERIKVVSYEDARTKEAAEEIAIRCRDTVKYAIQVIFSDAMLPSQ